MSSFKNPDTWKQNLAYQIGDFVLYSGTVYMAIKPVPAGTAMSSDYWFAFEEGAVVPTTEGSITENGTYDVEMWKTAEVDVEGIVPTGTIEITENGEGIDVSQYATADVNVSGGGGTEFGSLIDYTANTNTPEVNDLYNFNPIFSSVYVGETKIIDSGYQNSSIYQAAAGLTIELAHLTSSTVSGYVCTYSVDEYGDPDSYTAVTEWTETIDVTPDAMGGYSAKFTLPELVGENKQLFIVAQLTQ